MAQPANQFVHLHVHSQYSLLDGACRTADMVQRAKELGQSSLAITDHGCLFGIVDFYLKAAAAGVKPIIGIETYMAAGSRRDRTSTGVKDGGYHLLLLAADRTGYANLLKLSSLAYTEGFYYKPRIDREALRAHSAGLIATSACLGGEIPSALMADNRKRAKELAEFYLEIFGPERFFIELQKHVAEQDRVNPELIDLADRVGAGVVATNDVHFLLRDDHGPHDALCCIATGKLLTDEARMKYPTELYLKSADEMYAASDLPRWAEACANTARIAALCNVELDFKQNHAPVVRIERAGTRVQGPGPGEEVEGRKAKGERRKKAGVVAAAPGEAASAAVGSSAWYQEFCAGYQLLPFDATQNTLPKEEIKKQCDQALRELAEAGLIWRYGSGVTDEHRARLDRELKILADKNISAYFLVVWDFVNEARRRGIPATARGSGVGTMAGYCLGLSNACPVRYGLLFERFTDPDRSEYPDIDVDICQDGRQAIIDYVRAKYGHVAQIITFGTLKARAALRDVGRVLNIPLNEVDQVCKLVGDTLGQTIDKAMDQEPDLRKLYDDNPLHRQMIDTARRIEGLSRHAGVHAAGVVIATQPLDTIIPLYQPSGTDQVVTQWDGPTVEKMGLLKMDFLGLRTLSIIEKARKLIRATLSPEVIQQTVEAGVGYRVSGVGETAGSGPSKPETRNPKPESDPLDLDRLNCDDQKVFDLFRRGETAGVFQFESGGMRNLLVAMKPDRLEDLIAANALFRPGPMALIPDYCDRKHGRKPVPQAHPIVQKFTAETYGIMVYQEQVMQIVHELGSIPLRAAYTLIKNISKKKQKDIDAVRPKFVEGAQKQGLTAHQADELFELILKFAGYGFNKSHSTGYAIIAYQTAYLKTYFPVQYMAAVLTYESVSTDKVVEYIDECRRVVYPDPTRPRGIPVNPPDINLSEVGFTVVFENEPRDASHGHIRFGLSAVKGVGDKAIAAIIETRGKGGSFKSLYDFTERVPLGSVNRATIEALIKCGAFDALHGAQSRAAMVEGLDAAIGAGQRAASDRDSGQLNFFGGPAEPTAGGDPDKDARLAAAAPAVRLPNVPPWSNNDQLKHEKSVLGFYVSSHPLDQHRPTIERFANAAAADVDRLAAEVEVVLGGILTRVRTTLVKNGRSAGQKMAMITLEDSSGPLEAVVFSDTYAVTAPLLELDRIVFIKGKVDRRRERPSVIINQVIPVERAATALTQSVRIVLRDEAAVGESGGAHSEAAERNRAATLHENLVRLKELFRQSTLAAGTNGHGSSGVPVFIEIHQDGKIINVRLNNARAAVDGDLPQRVAAALYSGPCCELMGPPRILRAGNGNAIHQERALASGPGFPGSAGPDPLSREADEFCPSIDRY